MLVDDSPFFRDRAEAGALLADRLATYAGRATLVLGIPRGGVPVAAEVARRLDAELDVIVARKLGVPYQPELAMGAVTATGSRYLNEELLAELRISDAYLERVTAEQMAEARSREERFRGDRPPSRIEGRTTIVVDDGLATGATMRAALRSARARHPARLVMAVPVGPAETCAALRSEADEIVCLYRPEPFWAVGLHYQHFEAPREEEMQQLLRDAQARNARPAPESPEPRRS